ncbi:hypothetical protein [Luteolibacter marinus]|uniref:hypothetical protein n=1 Tax=Luteolibacter marinus TaxID=2776705 RepID=UPI0018672387|nr:hypothetical protein [Luteolibacter marinus]
MRAPRKPLGYIAAALLALLVVAGILLRPSPSAGTDGPGTVVSADPPEATSSNDQPQEVVKEINGPDGKLHHKVVFRLSPTGKPLANRIFDSDGELLFKSRFGYNPRPGSTHGKLVEEQIFDARVRQTDPKTGREIPVRRFIYQYGPDGALKAPATIETLPGFPLADLYGPSLAVLDLLDQGKAPEER